MVRQINDQITADSCAFEELVIVFKREYEQVYGRKCSRASVYFDAVRYDLYGVVPYYLGGQMEQLNVDEYCEENRITVAQFFRMAHIWYFYRDVDVSIDVEEYAANRTVPLYVQIFLAKCG